MGLINRFNEVLVNDKMNEGKWTVLEITANKTADKRECTLINENNITFRTRKVSELTLTFLSNIYTFKQ